MRWRRGTTYSNEVFAKLHADDAADAAVGVVGTFQERPEYVDRHEAPLLQQCTSCRQAVRKTSHDVPTRFTERSVRGETRAQTLPARPTWTMLGETC